MPWRYPGISPVTDSCGIAGGILPGQQKGIAGADYTETPLAKLGDRVPSRNAAVAPMIDSTSFDRFLVIISAVACDLWVFVL